MKSYTRAQVIELLRREVAKAGTPTALSRLIGCEHSRVIDTLKGYRPPHPLVLKYLGLVKVVSYQRGKR